MTTNIVMLVGPGRYKLTRQALESLVNHTDSSTYNLTLVLDNAEFRVDALVERCMMKEMAGLEGIGPETTILDVRNSSHTLSQLKNLGVAWSEQRWRRGDWLHLSDNDVYFTDGWLEKLLMIAVDGAPLGFRLWGGQIHPFHQPVKPIEDHARFGYAEHGILDGPSWLMRWDTWDKYGPFDRTTAPGVCQSEEYPFCQRLLTDGGRIGVIHPHVVIHTGLTHLNGMDAPGRKERELMIPEGVLAE